MLKHIVLVYAAHLVLLASCSTREEPRRSLNGPTVTLTMDEPTARHTIIACVSGEPPEEGLALDLDASAHLRSGGDASVELYLEIGDALSDEQDGDTDLVTLSPSSPNATLEQLAGARGDTPELEEACTDGFDVAFSLLEGTSEVEIEWTVEVFTVGAFVETKLEAHIED